MSLSSAASLPVMTGETSMIIAMVMAMTIMAGLPFSVLFVDIFYAFFMILLKCELGKWFG